MAPIFVKRYAGSEKLGEYTELYGFTLRQNGSAVTVDYIEDNKNYTPASANCTNGYNYTYNFVYGTFDYGSWKNVFFIKNLKPCMLKYDGAVDYYLNPDDVTKKVNGGDSDVKNQSYQGNAMVEFPKIYWKIVNNADGSISVYVCDGKKDKNFVCWSHIDANGREIPYCYMSMYLGKTAKNSSTGLYELRSLSYGAPSTATFSNLMTYAENNNRNGQHIWEPDVYCDRVLLTILTVLLGKTVDSQDVFGYGRCTRFSSLSSDNTAYGTTDTKGMFAPNNYAYAADGNGSCMKAFGINDLWSRFHRFCVGLILDKSTSGSYGIRVKWTYGKSDGSAQEGYSGYQYANRVALPEVAACYSGSTYRRITGIIADNKYGFLPKSVDTTNNTRAKPDYFGGDGAYSISSIGSYNYAAMGGGQSSISTSGTTDAHATSNANVVLRNGIFGTGFISTSNTSASTLATGLSCKPLAA
ncbi:MAG: hypothetical protein NC548_26935 [Lachnospiraceae bacterium]|nr:hypothetical protein [Lachnospiraceae bacterium]